MAEFEILVSDVSTVNPVYFVLYNVDAQIANSATELFESPIDSSWPSYDIAMTELGTNTNTYRGDIPSWITTGGTYIWVAYEQLGVSPAVSDDVLASGIVNWTGSAVYSGSVPASEGDLFTLAEYKTYKNITSTDSARDATLEFLIDVVSNAVKRYVDHSVVAATRDEIYHGNGSYWIGVNNYPIISIESITFNYGSTSSEIISGGEFTFVVDGNNGTILFNDNSTEKRRFTGNIRVQYSAGYTDAIRPADLKMAGMVWCSYLFDQKNTDITKSSESLGDYSYSLATQIDTRIPDAVKNLLNTYKASPIL